jgi:hypothetical protein
MWRLSVVASLLIASLAAATIALPESQVRLPMACAALASSDRTASERLFEN